MDILKWWRQFVKDWNKAWLEAHYPRCYQCDHIADVGCNDELNRLLKKIEDGSQV